MMARTVAAFIVGITALLALAACDRPPALEEALIAREDLDDEWRLRFGERGEDALCGETIDRGPLADSVNVFFERVDVAVFLNHDVRRYPAGEAEAFMQRLHEGAEACDAWTSLEAGTEVEWTKGPSVTGRAGDDVVTFKLTATVPERGPFMTESVYIRRGNYISSFVYGGFFAGGVYEQTTVERLQETADMKLARIAD